MVKRFAFRLTIVAVIGCVVSGMTARSEAGPILPTPAGLTPGDTFRFVFVTDVSTTAFLPDISVYDAIVTGDALGATYQGQTISWEAIGSTPSVSAIVHDGTNPFSRGEYLVTGVHVATGDGQSPFQLWSGLLISPIDEDIKGNNRISKVWSGSNPNGTAVRGYELGAARRVSFSGFTNSTNFTWVSETVHDQDAFFPLYGISELLTVPGASTVPEPSSGLLAVIGGSIGLVLARFRKSKVHRQ